MISKFLNKLSGGQITAIVIAAILAPGAVGAATALQKVAVVDPLNGTASQIDSARQLRVFDAVAGYRNNPANLVEIPMRLTGDVPCQEDQQYVIPTGQALVTTAMSGYQRRVEPLPVVNFAFAILDGPGCSGNILTTWASTVVQSTGDLSERNFPVAVDYGSGILVRAGKTVSAFSGGGFGRIFIHGYLVPAAAVPALTAQQLASQPKPVTAAQLLAELKRR